MVTLPSCPTFFSRLVFFGFLKFEINLPPLNDKVPKIHENETRAQIFRVVHRIDAKAILLRTMQQMLSDDPKHLAPCTVQWLLF